MLDGVQLITRGNPLRFQNFLANLNPAYEQKIILCDSGNTKKPLVCGLNHPLCSQSAQILYMTATPEDNPVEILELLEEAARISGAWGAFNLVCELDITSPLLEIFRRIDFNTWARQRFWQVKMDTYPDKHQISWQVWNRTDIKAMRALHQSLVPKLFHNLEPLARRTTLGLVLKDDQGGLKGFADLAYGHKGIWAMPIIHPDAADNPAIILDLLASIPNRNKSPVTLCVHSYQPWLEDLLGHLDASCSNEQALLVKYLATRQKVSNALAVPGFKKSHADTGLPVPHIDLEGKPKIHL